MNKEREALKLALVALEKLARLGNGDTYGNSIGNVIAQAAITAIKEALAQPSDSVEPTHTPEQLAALGWQSIECPFCGTSGAQAFSKSDCDWEGIAADQAMTIALMKSEQPEQEPPFSVNQAYAMAQVCLDIHDALGCAWGDNVYLTISQLKELNHD